MLAQIPVALAFATLAIGGCIPPVTVTITAVPTVAPPSVSGVTASVSASHVHVPTVTVTHTGPSVSVPTASSPSTGGVSGGSLNLVGNVVPAVGGLLGGGLAGGGAGVLGNIGGSSGSTSHPATGGSGTTPAPQSGGQCKSSEIQCCKNVQNAASADSHTKKLLGLLGVDLHSITGEIGTDCSPLNVVGISGQSCSSQPVCCSNNSFHGVVAIGCTPINVNL